MHKMLTLTQRCTNMGADMHKHSHSCTHSHTTARPCLRSTRAFAQSLTSTHIHTFPFTCARALVCSVSTPGAGRGRRSGEKLLSIRQLLGRSWDGPEGPAPRKPTALG